MDNVLKLIVLLIVLNV